MPQSGLRVGVVFGGRSVEHEVSIITGLQACDALSERHEPVPLYIDRQGGWFTGRSLREIATYRAATLDATPVALDLSSGTLQPAAQMTPPPGERRRGIFGGGARERTGAAEGVPPRLDVIIPATHGTQGEDGCLQGALELADLPYAGPTLESAVLAMNKARTKAILRAAGIPVLEDITLRRDEYEREGAPAVVERIRARFGLPVYAKPASLGSSVGVSRCTDERALADALELCFELDRLAIIEPSVEHGREINCAVLGRVGGPDEPRVSLCEQPVAGDGGFLSYEDKYLRGGGKGTGGEKSGAPPAGGKDGGMSSAQRLIPAPIGEELTAEVQELARRTFQAIGGAGVTRVDLLLDDRGQLFVNEPNTIPGSFAFYLFEPAGLPFPDLLDALIDLALAEHAERRRTTRTFESNLLAMRGEGAKR